MSLIVFCSLEEPHRLGTVILCVGLPMLIAFNDRDVAFCILFGMLAFILIWFGLARYRVRRIFGARPQDRTVLELERRKLDDINAECRRFVFTAERVADVSLSGHSIRLIYGMVGFLEPLEGDTGRRVFAIAEGEEIEWMRRFPDVFEIADSMATSAVFWVNLRAVIRLARQ